MQTVHIRLGQLERDIEERPLKQQQDMATIVSPIAVAKAVVKIDIRLLVSNKIDQLRSHIDKLEIQAADSWSQQTLTCAPRTGD